MAMSPEKIERLPENARREALRTPAAPELEQETFPEIARADPRRIELLKRAKRGIEDRCIHSEIGPELFQGSAQIASLVETPDHVCRVLDDHGIALLLAELLEQHLLEAGLAMSIPIDRLDGLEHPARSGRHVPVGKGIFVVGIVRLLVVGVVRASFPDADAVGSRFRFDGTGRILVVEKLEERIFQRLPLDTGPKFLSGALEQLERKLHTGTDS
jgi:hypothetical protein